MTGSIKERMVSSTLISGFMIKNKGFTATLKKMDSEQEDGFNKVETGIF